MGDARSPCPPPRSAGLFALGAALLVASSGCAHDQGGGALHARKVVLEREVNGLRDVVARLERGETIFPDDAVLVSIAEGVVKDFVTAQLPVSVELERFRIELKTATAMFKGTPALILAGSIVHVDHPDFVGEVAAIGSLDKVAVDPGSGTLRAEVTVDHVDLLRIAGLEKLLAGATVDELARAVRKQLEGRLPRIEIPVKLEQAINLPSITEGPVRLRGASMPLAASVANVLAGRGVLWIAIRVVPGELVRTGEGTS